MGNALKFVGLTVLVLVWFCGCSSQSGSVEDPESSKPELKVEGPLRVLVVDDEPLSEVLAREWRARSEHALEIKNIGQTELQQVLGQEMPRLDTDVVIFPPAWMGELAEGRLIRPVPSDLLSEPEFRSTEIYGQIRRREMQWNSQSYALPLGSPVLVLLRRTDLVPEAPQTWEEFDKQAENLAGSLDDGMLPIAQPLGEGWASKMLLARSAGYLYDQGGVSSVFSYSTMEPRVTSPPFVRALEELVKTAHPKSREFDPSAALTSFLDGNAAMAITWPTAVVATEANKVAFSSRDLIVTGYDRAFCLGRLDGHRKWSVVRHRVWF